MASIPSSRGVVPSITTAVDNGQTQARAQLTQLARTGAPPSDPRAAEVGRKVDDLVRRNFGGDYKKAFQHYAGPNGEVSRAGVRKLLGDAGVGTDMDLPIVGNTRDRYTDGLMDKFDANRNGSVSWGEFTGGLRSVGVNIN